MPDCKNRLRVLHISKSDTKGGAARAAYRLHTGLKQLGCSSTMVVIQKDSDDQTVTALARPELSARLRRRLRKWQMLAKLTPYRSSRPHGLSAFRDHRSIYRSDLRKQVTDVDIIHLHWVADFVDYPTFFNKISHNVPIIWTLHDMNPFTGGCHYDGGCARYKNTCGQCPQLGSKRHNDLSHQVWRAKRDALATLGQEQLHLVAPSRWLATEAQASTVFGRFPVIVIPHGLDVAEFAPRDKDFARSTLGIPTNARVVLFVAAWTHVIHKGFAILVEALETLKDLPNLYLLSVGHQKPKINTSIPHQHLGFIENNRLLSLIYSAAELFVIPSLQEAFGQTALEAMACGTPVIGSDVGGIPDIVQPERTGLLVPPKNPDALSAAIRKLLQNPDLCLRMAENSRRIAIEQFTLERQAQSYVNLYNEAARQVLNL